MPSSTANHPICRKNENISGRLPHISLSEFSGGSESPNQLIYRPLTGGRVRALIWLHAEK
jgi:hypothetical protein